MKNHKDSKKACGCQQQHTFTVVGGVCLLTGREATKRSCLNPPPWNETTYGDSRSRELWEHQLWLHCLFSLLLSAHSNCRAGSPMRMFTLTSFLEQKTGLRKMNAYKGMRRKEENIFNIVDPEEKQRDLHGLYAQDVLSELSFLILEN